MGTPKLTAAGKLLQAGVDAEGSVVRRSIHDGGRRIVDSQVVSKAVSALPRTIEQVVHQLSGSHAATKRIFAEVEECFEKVLSRPSPIKARQARLKMDSLDTQWQEVQAELQGIIRDRAQTIDKLGAKEAEQHAKDHVKQLSDLFNARFVFTNWLSEMPYDKPPAEFRALIRKELEKSTASKDVLEEITDWVTSMPFLKRNRPTPRPPVSPARGRELVKEARKIESEAAKPLKPKGFKGGAKTGRSKADPTVTAARQAQALDELFRYHPEGDPIYDDLVDIIDERFTKQLKIGGSIDDEKFIADIVNKAQGRVGETLALRHPSFLKNVWKPTNRTAKDLSARLNAKLPQGTRAAEKWTVHVVTEPTFATGKDGSGGELMDAGIWLIRDGKTAEAMPIFGLEVKSGEPRGSILQLISDRARSSGGLVQLPGSNRTYRMILPPRVEFQSALATTRKISDKRLLGALEEGGEGTKETLGSGQGVLTFRLPMRRTDLRAATTALVTARLRQLKKLRER